jgi:hypothetical protein
VRAQHKSVLRSGMAPWRVANPGESKLRLMNAETMDPRIGFEGLIVFEGCDAPAVPGASSFLHRV